MAAAEAEGGCVTEKDILPRERHNIVDAALPVVPHKGTPRRGQPLQGKGGK
jgi:hypothetical protein